MATQTKTRLHLTSATIEAIRSALFSSVIEANTALRRTISITTQWGSSSPDWALRQREEGLQALRSIGHGGLAEIAESYFHQWSD